MAIVLTEKREETNSVVGLSLLIMIGLFIISSGVIITTPSLLKYTGINNTSHLIVIVLLLITLGLGVQNILYQWHTKFENYEIMSKNRVVQKLSIVFIQLFIVILFSSHFGLIWGFALGLLFSLFILILPLKQQIKSFRFNKDDIINRQKIFRFLYLLHLKIVKCNFTGASSFVIGASF